MTRGNDGECSHVIKGLLYLVLLLSGSLPLGMLDNRNRGIDPDGVGPGNVANGVENVRECLL